MSLRQAVAHPFLREGTTAMGESAFVVALSLDRNWFSPDQAKRLVDVAVGEGLLRREDGDLHVTFDAGSVSLPDKFEPDESILQERSTFERVLEVLTDAGHDKQDAVAAVNKLQAELDVTIEAAAVLYAHRHGLDVTGLARQARTEV